MLISMWVEPMFSTSDRLPICKATMKSINQVEELEGREDKMAKVLS